MQGHAYKYAGVHIQYIIYARARIQLRARLSDTRTSPPASHILHSLLSLFFKCTHTHTHTHTQHIHKTRTLLTHISSLTSKDRSCSGATAAFSGHHMASNRATSLCAPRLHLSLGCEADHHLANANRATRFTGPECSGGAVVICSKSSTVTSSVSVSVHCVFVVNTLVCVCVCVCVVCMRVYVCLCACMPVCVRVCVNVCVYVRGEKGVGLETTPHIDQIEESPHA